MIFSLNVDTSNNPEYVRSIAFWVRRLFDLTQYRFESISANQTIRITRTLYVVDTSAGALTITLPPAKETKGEWIKIKNLTGSHKITVEGDGAETIDGALNHEIGAKKECHEFVSYGDGWYVAQP